MNYKCEVRFPRSGELVKRGSCYALIMAKPADERIAELEKQKQQIAKKALNKTGVVSWYETTGEL